MKLFALSRQTFTNRKITIISTSKRGLFNFSRAGEPIKYETSKILPYSQENFFEVVRNVDDYQNFIPWIS